MKKPHGNIGNTNAAKNEPEKRAYSNRFSVQDMQVWRSEAQKAGMSVAQVITLQMNKWAKSQKSKRTKK